ncbi:S-adenosyl-L-methionine-dependent methyltransferase [Backusella circina FSU 941]|nr:S-adenosyl-L-methionine-dependent methyltransferase [Backusella circina FSU 941]
MIETLVYKPTAHQEEESNDEIDRLVSQHYILRTAFDSDYSVPSSLFQKKKNTVVLDIGCGPGTWTMEMASQFPKVTFIGVDFRDMSPHDIKPKNCHFQQHLDIVKLPFGDNSVDYIFQRDMNWFLNAENWIPLIKEYFRILKPGGWIELVEPDLESQSSLENESYLNNKLLNLITHRGKDAFVARKLSSIMAASGFRRIESRFQSIPLGWGKGKDAFSKACASQQLWLLKSLQPSLSQMTSIAPDKYNQYLDDLAIEWCEARTYINWHRSIAQKPF